MRRGELYRVSEFLSRTLGKKSDPSVGFAQDTIRFLKDLDDVQSTNPSVTLALHAGDGLWVYYLGQKLLFLKPTLKFLNLHLFEPLDSSQAKRLLLKFLNDRDKRDRFPRHLRGASWSSWQIPSTGMGLLLKFLRALPASQSGPSISKLHARVIPGDVRQQVLQEFRNNGQICPGVAGRSKRHKLRKDDTIEIDHIIPVAHRGSSSYRNVQILCMKCNRLKSATSL